MEQTTQTFEAAVAAYQTRAADVAARIDAYAASAGLGYVAALRVVRAELARRGVFAPADTQAAAEEAAEWEVFSQGGWR